MLKNKDNNLLINRDWKEKNKLYLREVQIFLDKSDNIKDESLKRKIIGQMLRCDKILTEIAEKNFKKYYKLGLKNSKKE